MTSITPQTITTQWPALHALLDQWTERGWLRPLDRALAVFLQEQVPDAPPLVLLLAALASHQLGRGHVCLDLAALLADPDLSLSLPPESDDGMLPPPRPSWCLAGLDLPALNQALHQVPALVVAGAGTTPLVLTDARLYLRRYWQYEQDIGRAIGERLTLQEKQHQTLADEQVRRWLDMLFLQPAQPDGINWQRVACALAAGSAFAVITGGPGTGKTTTVVRLLALLQALQLSADLQAMPLRIRMAAPTGKAAARLNDAVAGQVEALPLPDDALGQRIRAAIPTQVTTVHRLLGSRPNSRHFRHHARNPLPVDLVVVDEASMIDLELMSQLLQALPPEARLILLGDKNQLASVEAGAVLGALCDRADQGHYLPRTRDWLSAVSGDTLPPDLQDQAGRSLDQHIIMLRQSHRFSTDSGIGRLAQAVNGGDPAQVAAVWEGGSSLSDLARVRLRGEDDQTLEQVLIRGGAGLFRNGGETPEDTPRGYAHYLTVMRDTDPGPDAEAAAVEAWAEAVLAAQAEFQCLCVIRGGPWGVEQMNQRIAQALGRAGLINPEGIWYPGRPVMVTGNDYGLGLMNGDMGVALAMPDKQAPGGRIVRVAFPATDGSRRVRWVLPSRLSQVDTVFAMTVHKSQGSEFRHTALVLPDAPSPILTRELIYTAITRARRWFSLLMPRTGVLEAGVKRRVLRSSGLRAALLSFDTAPDDPST
ncbi:DNA helicase/exodeoxyribonuclease V, alpha subunit [Ectothiorhodospira magna]|uniref:RecBCD enzyme subunit RecD n=1 Tax=Ectothiorhodospira magna TaxID=867345 RepID=A0A1H9AR33_9GAMM|nr:exodeoxyribonuclease V subunit alpha [Ectothiorhodospira magna]SEP78388.1 DNA helicase/exodeoxyribonuclease V, alpha subunit [Ectothiorhodospira magna]